MFFKVSKVNLNGSLSTLDNLGELELNPWMTENYGKFATIQVEASNGCFVMYTDNGSEWEKIKCWR